MLLTGRGAAGHRRLHLRLPSADWYRGPDWEDAREVRYLRANRPLCRRFFSREVNQNSERNSSLKNKKEEDATMFGTTTTTDH